MKYEVTTFYSSCSTVEVEADSKEEAIQKADELPADGIIENLQYESSVAIEVPEHPAQIYLLSHNEAYGKDAAWLPRID